MKDVEYVQMKLAAIYKTEYDNEIPYPELSTLIDQTDFDYASGKIAGEKKSGNKNRDGLSYLQIKQNGKCIYCHRFIVAVTLGKWPPREFNVDHINHDPSDNRPENLRVVTPRDNSANRRTATLPELADIGTKAEELAKAKLEKLEVRKKLEEAQKTQQDATEAAVPSKSKSDDDKFYSQNWNSKPKIEKPFFQDVAGLEREKAEETAREKTKAEQSVSQFYPMPQRHPVFTGETKPAIPSGVWHKTTIGSWWWRHD